MHTNDDITIGCGALNEYFARWRLRFWRTHKTSVYVAPEFNQSSRPSPNDFVQVDDEYGKVLYIDWDHEEVKCFMFKSKALKSYDLDAFMEYDHPRGSFKRHWRL